MALLFTYLFLALFVSFICSILEAVLLSTPVAYLNVQQEKGSKAAGHFIELKNNIDRPISAILTFNTVAHTVGAAGVGAQAVKIWGDEYFGLVSAVLTILILVVTEIIPKTMGARYWRELSLFAAPVMRFMIVAVYPFVYLSAFLTRMISKNSAEQTTSREEISALANIGAEEGIFGDKENKIIQNLIKLRHVKVSEIMTPRVVVAMADEAMTAEDFLKNKDFLRYSRIPVYSENPENISGYVIRQDVFEKLAENEEGVTLKDIKRDIVVVHESKAVLQLWEILLDKKEHIAWIVDEFGGMEGIVTMEDVLETLLGFEIIDEKDTVTDMQQYARERWHMKQAKYRMLEDTPDKTKAKDKPKNETEENPEE